MAPSERWSEATYELPDNLPERSTHESPPRHRDPQPVASRIAETLPPPAGESSRLLPSRKYRGPAFVSAARRDWPPRSMRDCSDGARRPCCEQPDVPPSARPGSWRTPRSRRKAGDRRPVACSMRERESRDGYGPCRPGRSAPLDCQVRGPQFRRNMTIATRGRRELR